MGSLVSEDPEPSPPVINYVFSFILVGIAWGFTTPFIRRAAKTHKPPHHAILAIPSVQSSVIKRTVYGTFFSVTDILRNPGYSIPLILNLTGSIWFFLLIGHAELSLTVPIVNTLGLLFTILGEWWVENKVISKETTVGVTISLMGIALCVISKK